MNNKIIAITSIARRIKDPLWRMSYVTIIYFQTLTWNATRPCPKQGYADPLPLRFTPIFMKDAHSAESKEKLIFRFFRF